MDAVVKLAQEELNKLMDNYYSNPENSDGGSDDEKYRILLKIAKKFDIEENLLSI